MRPVTPEQWQDAVDAAHAMTVLELARLYGLITAHLEVNIERCEEILADGRAQGINPRAVTAQQFLVEFNVPDALRRAKIERRA